ncbi:short chain dehydrogenase [Xylariaceae sp. FL1019]|nr:short chain dehydrogenase [Xylariaceae sp. FL1019]
MTWQYKTVLMVGCTAGLGVAMADRMIEHGSFVIAVGRRKDRLEEFQAKHGKDRVAISQFDITKLDEIKGWAEGIIKAHPTLDCVVLNAGIQRTLNFTQPAEIDLERVQLEITTNYTSYISLLAAFLPHLQSRTASPASIIGVTSGLALVPLPRCANYCAVKAALHSLLWSMRSQLGNDEGSKHIKVIEVVPPAVQTELHVLQPDLVAQGLGNIGITIEEFIESAWAGLESGQEEILVGPLKEGMGHLEDGRREAFRRFAEATAPKGSKAVLGVDGA